MFSSKVASFSKIMNQCFITLQLIVNKASKSVFFFFFFFLFFFFVDTRASFFFPSARTICHYIGNIVKK